MEIPGYEIEKQIGKGGMAGVYLALHKALDRKVAIKVMNRQTNDDSDYSARFLREARIVANLSHPNIVTIFDVGEHDGHDYIVMELLPSGETLSDKIKQGIRSDDTLSIIKQVATALDAAHDKNIVHRDIKPDNIMFRADGSVVLMDFGVARSVDAAATKMTQAGMVIGTPQYMSPELGEGHEIGAFSDIYSLGVVFYEMLTGKVPYTADTPIALVYKHITAPVPKLMEYQSIYQPLLDRMMAKKRGERYKKCSHIIADIDNITKGKVASHATDITKQIYVKEYENLAVVDKEIEAQDNDKNKKGGLKKPLFWITSLLLIVAGVSVFVVADIEKLKVLIGLDPGPIYSRVGKLISVPGGSFQMGNSNGDSEETPAHQVNLKRYKLSETEVTQKQWQLVMGSTPFHFKGCDNCPADNVSWDDVQLFLKKLNKQTGLRFRLPSEAEWEYACRSGGKQEKYCGGSDDTKLAWSGNNSNGKTQAVAQKQDNDLGLYDMSGNVWEWTQDCWNDNYYGAPINGSAWLKGDCSQRVLRGGSLLDLANGLSSTGRLESPSDEGSRNFGFRLALDI